MGKPTEEQTCVCPIKRANAPTDKLMKRYFSQRIHLNNYAIVWGIGNIFLILNIQFC
jgi:hypothetical protein